MAEGKLNRWTAWAARSSDVWSNRQSFRLSRSRAACGGQRGAGHSPGEAFRLSPVGIGSKAVEFLLLSIAGGRVRCDAITGRHDRAYVIRLRRQRDRRNSQHRCGLGSSTTISRLSMSMRAWGRSRSHWRPRQKRLGFIDGRLRPQAIQGGLLGGAVARRLLRFGRRLRRGRRIRKWGRAGAGIAKPRLSIRRESCGRNFSQLSSLAKREASSLVGLGRAS